MKRLTMAQQTVIDKYFEKFADNDRFTKVTINQKMFSLFANFEGGTEEETEFMQAISKLDGLKILVADSCDHPKELFDKTSKDIKKAGYEELMSVKDAVWFPN